MKLIVEVIVKDALSAEHQDLIIDILGEDMTDAARQALTDNNIQNFSIGIRRTA